MFVLLDDDLKVVSCCVREEWGCRVYHTHPVSNAVDLQKAFTLCTSPFLKVLLKKTVLNKVIAYVLITLSLRLL